MSITGKNWKNKNGTSNRSCNCGTWKNHWIKNSSKPWPEKCSVSGCNNDATSGLHVINADVEGERIIPGCASCNQLVDYFDLKGLTTVVSANKRLSCEQ